jgi:hypothetical protein
MMYPYLTFEDGTEVVHSELQSHDGINEVLVHFERPTEDGFDSVRCSLPSYAWTPWEGHFTDEELSFFEKFLEANAHLIYRYASTGGVKIA